MAERFPSVSALATLATAGDDASSPASAGVSFTERAVIRALQVAGPRDREAAARAAGLSRLPGTNRSAGNGAVRCYWIAPETWLVIAYGPSDSLRDKLAAVFEVAADASGGWTVIRAEGPAVRPALAAHCTLDLHPAVFQTGHCAQTRMGHIGVLIDRPPGEDRFDLVVGRSFAIALVESLAETSAYRGCTVRSA